MLALKQRVAEDSIDFSSRLTVAMALDFPRSPNLQYFVMDAYFSPFLNFGFLNGTITLADSLDAHGLLIESLCHQWWITQFKLDKTLSAVSEWKEEGCVILDEEIRCAGQEGWERGKRSF